MPITGFRAGDTIALAHQSSGFFGSTYSYNWDQPTHQLTIFETPTFLQTFELARLTLNGTYGRNYFTLVDNTSFPIGPGAVSVNNNGVLNAPDQLDIVVTPPPGDIFFRNADGSAALWQVKGTTIIGGGQVGSNPGPYWHPIATGDFNGDGFADILWQNSGGQVVVWELNGPTCHRQRQPRESGAELACGRGGRFQRRRPLRCPVSEQRRRHRRLGAGRRRGDRQRRARQSGADLACGRGRRLQWRRPLRHPVSEQQRRGRRLGAERRQCDRRRQPRQPGTEPGMSSGRAMSTATAGPTSCGRTTAARSQSGSSTGRA